MVKFDVVNAQKCLLSMTVVSHLHESSNYWVLYADKYTSMIRVIQISNQNG